MGIKPGENQSGYHSKLDLERELQPRSTRQRMMSDLHVVRPTVHLEICGNNSSFVPEGHLAFESFKTEMDGFFIEGTLDARIELGDPGLGTASHPRFVLGFQHLHIENLQSSCGISPSIHVRANFGTDIGPYPTPGALESLLQLHGSVAAPEGGTVAADSICTLGVFVLSKHGHVVQQALTTSGVAPSSRALFEFERDLSRNPPNLVGVRPEDWIHLRLVGRLNAREVLELRHPNLESTWAPVLAPTACDSSGG